MDDEKLISLVQSYELVYSKCHRDYKSIEKKRAAWQQIAKELGVSEMHCTRRWTVLRDRYTKECRRLQTLANSGVSKGPIWPLYEAMDFIKPHIVMRGCRGITRLPSVTSPIAMKNQFMHYSSAPLTTKQELNLEEYDSVAQPFEFKVLSSPLPQHHADSESEPDSYQPTMPTPSSSPHVHMPNSSQMYESKGFPIIYNERTDEQNVSRKRHSDSDDKTEQDSSGVVQLFKRICESTEMRHKNPAVYGFGQMIVETICGMSERKQVLAMQKVTEVVMALKLEPEPM